MLDARRRELGAQLKAARLDAHLSVRQLAARAHISATSVFRLESGEIARPKIDELSRVAEALNLSLASVLDAAGIPLHRYLPDLSSYLRERYPELPAEALTEMERYFQHISRSFRGGGPIAREDEL